MGVIDISISYGGVTDKKRSESLFVAEVKETQHHDTILLQLKGATHSRDLRFSPKGRWCGSLSGSIMYSYGGELR